jgi:hypothetical protein
MASQHMNSSHRETAQACSIAACWLQDMAESDRWYSGADLENTPFSHHVPWHQLKCASPLPIFKGCSCLLNSRGLLFSSCHYCLHCLPPLASQKHEPCSSRSTVSCRLSHCLRITSFYTKHCSSVELTTVSCLTQLHILWKERLYKHNFQVCQLLRTNDLCTCSGSDQVHGLFIILAEAHFL